MLGLQNSVWLFYYFVLKGIMAFKVKEFMHFLEKKALIKTKRNRTHSFTHSFRETSLCFSSYTEPAKWIQSGGAMEDWKIFSAILDQQEKFLILNALEWFVFYTVCIYTKCILHFQKIHTSTYQKTLLHTLFCLLLKIV